MDSFIGSSYLETSSAAQILAVVLFGLLGMFFFLPRPRGRIVPLGIFFTVASFATLAGYLINTYGLPYPNLIETVLFWLFSAGAVGFGTILVTQTNPARGAIAFAFVILSSCGLFLLLAAPFLMAATIIIYMGAIVVTFLFVLMLSQTKGPSNENNRTREPLLGALAGFAFLGLVLFALHLNIPSKGGQEEIDQLVASLPRLPVVSIRTEERDILLTLSQDIQTALQSETSPDDLLSLAKEAQSKLENVVGSSNAKLPAEAANTIQRRLRFQESNPHVATTIAQANELKLLAKATVGELEQLLLDAAPDVNEAKAKLAQVREKSLLLAGRGELPARNVQAMGFTLYSIYLIDVELAGALLLTATVGAVCIAQKKGGAA